LIVLVVGLIYLTQAGKVTAYDYEAQRVDREIAELEATRDALAVENARLTSVRESENVAYEGMVEGSVAGYVAE
jgi:hypothetical protein